VEIGLRGPALPLWVCARRLAPYGFALQSSAELGGNPWSDRGSSSLSLAYAPEAGPDAPGGGYECQVSWLGPVSGQAAVGSEAVVQALCGLMHVHGLEGDRPRRLGLEVASAAAGVLAGHAVLAAQIGRQRGRTVSTATTSVLQAGLLMMSQYIARGRCSEVWGEWVQVPRGSEPGPPFRSADRRWFEVEILDAGRWRNFWSAVAVDPAVLGPGWTLFNARYSTGIGSLPAGYHQAAGRHTLAEIVEMGTVNGVSLVPLRGYREVGEDPGPGVVEHPLRHGSAANGTPAPAVPRDAGSPRLPLDGLVVVEATSRLQGPLAGLLLQFLGARVLRVEPPGGDVERMVPPVVDDAGAFFMSVNRGKTPVEVDLGSPTGRRELEDLIAGADVFLHNWRPGKAAEWGLGWDDVVHKNPGLVYCHASGWGPVAASCPPVGTEFLVQAYAGLGEGLNPGDVPGLPSRVLLVDFMGGLLACEAVLAGLLQRHETGRGVWMESSLFAGAMALQAHVLEAMTVGDEPGRKEGRPIWGQLDRPVRTLDGWLAVTVEDDNNRRRLAGVCGVPVGGDTEADERAIVASLRRGDTADRWERRLHAEGVPCARVRTDLRGLADDPLLTGLLEPLGTRSVVPRAPWTFR